MRKPMTVAKAEETFGETFLESTCSVTCKHCWTSNFFAGEWWEETVPPHFECVTCGLPVVSPK